jgi:hypothetical protein
MINNQVLKVRDHPTLYRDPNSKAILVVDQTSRQNYINQRTLAQKTVSSSESLRNEMIDMKQELGELKEMLHILISQSKTDK